MSFCYLGHIGIEHTDTEKFFFHEQRTTDLVRGCMLEYTQIAVYASEYFLRIRVIECGYLHFHTLQSLSRDVYPVRFDIRTQELDTLVYLADLQLAHVQLQSKIRTEEVLYLMHKRKQPFLVVTDYYTIVYITAIILAFQHALDELVEWIQVHIAEKLTCQVADRQSKTVCEVQHALCRIETYPAFQLSHNNAILARIEHYDYLCQPTDKIHVQHVVPYNRRVLADTMCCHLPDCADSKLQQLRSDNVHEVTPDIRVHSIARPLPIQRLLSAKVRNSANSVMRSPALDTRIAVLNERPLEELMRVVEIQVMHNSVSEHRSEDLPFLGVLHYKAFRR